MKLQMRGTVVLDNTLGSTKRFVVHQGGTRSSKTYSIAQAVIVQMLSQKGKTFSIARKTFTALRATAMRDFFEILHSLNIYDEALHNMTEHTYTFNGNLIEFISMDQPQKKRGAKRDWLWMNEANEFTLEDFMQLNLRTTERVILDYNPSDFHHWIYDVVLPREDCDFFQSTYRDNPFLPAAQVAEIERLEGTSDTHWRVFGLGERAAFKNTIYTNWQPAEPPETFDTKIYGLDFGFHNPTALVEVGIKDTQVYWRELLYESGLTNADLIERLEQLITNKKTFLYADAAEPNRIEEIRRRGFNIHPADKAVFDGIDFVKRHRINVDKFSPNLLKEIQTYKWAEDKTGKVLDEVVKIQDHALDAARYAMYTTYRRFGARFFGISTAPKTASRLRKPKERKSSFLDSF